MASNIRNDEGLVDLCGIYEWRAAKTRNGRKKRVVYVGSTCTRRGKFHGLRSRIINYCRNGNHKADLINDALRRGYKLEVRYKRAANEEGAKAQENQLLAMYNYAWNVRNNAIRSILP